MSRTRDRQTQALVKRGETLPAVQSLPVTFADGTEARILLCGPDTIYFSFMVEVSATMWERLLEEQEIARMREFERKAQYAPEWLGAVMATTGAKGGYHFRVEYQDFTIKLLKGVPNRPAIYVEMRALALHINPRGALGACEDACTYIRDVLLGDWSLEESQRQINLDQALCSRLDLHCDWQGGWFPTYTSGEDRLFIKPSRVKWKPEMEGNTCTGYRFGTGKVQARIYNKTLQTTITHCEWYRELLIQRQGLAYNPTLPVWRLEFQMLRDGVKGFKLYCKPEVTDPDQVIDAELEKEDLPHIGSVRKALHWADKLWEYLTRRWLRVVAPSEDVNRARWVTHPTWQTLQGGFQDAMAGAPLPDEKVQLVRKQRHTGYERFLHRIEVGVLALVDTSDTDPAATAHSWFAHLAHVLDLAQQHQEGTLRISGEMEKVLNGMGANGGSANQRYTLKAVLDELLGLFTGSGVAKLGMRDVATVADLLCEIVEDLEMVAKEKGGLSQLLYEKRCKLYKFAEPHFFKAVFAA